MDVYVLIYFFNELDILDITLHELNDKVTKFVIVEYPFSSNRRKRPLYYSENKERFKKFEHKIHHVVDNDPYYNKDGLSLFWTRKHSPFLLNTLSEAGCQPNDYVFAIDGDVVLKKRIFDNFDYTIPSTLHMNWYQYYFNVVFPNASFAWSIAAPYHILQEVGGLGKIVGWQPADGIVQQIADAGYHFAKCGGVDKIIENIKGYPHQEFSIDPELIDPIKVQERIDNLWGWTDKDRGTNPATWEVKVLPYIPEYYPDYVNNNPQIYDCYFKDGMK